MSRTTIEIPINYELNNAYQKLNQYFTEHGYTSVVVDDETIMKSSHIAGFTKPWFIAIKGEQSKIILESFVGKPHKKESDLEGFVGAMIKMPAKNALVEIEQLLTTNQAVVTNSQPAVQPQINTVADGQTPTNETSTPSIPAPPTYIPQAGALAEKNAKYAYISIGIGIFAIIGALTGTIAVGGLGLLLGIMLGVGSLKTSKRKLAILGIILNILSLPILILVVLAHSL